MFKLLLKLALIYMVISTGLTASELLLCRRGFCTDQLEKAARETISIDWRPISIWPEEAKRFKATQ